MDEWSKREIVLSLEEREAKRKHGNCIRSAARKKRKLQSMTDEQRAERRDKKLQKQKDNLMKKNEEETNRLWSERAAAHFHPNKHRWPQTITCHTEPPKGHKDPSPPNATPSKPVETTLALTEEEKKQLEKDREAQEAINKLREAERKKRFEIRRAAHDKDVYSKLMSIPDLF